MSSPTLTENLYSFSPGCGNVMAVPLWPLPETEVAPEEPTMAWSTDALLEKKIRDYLARFRFVKLKFHFFKSSVKMAFFAKKYQIILATGWGILADFWVPNEIMGYNFQNLLVFWFREISKNLISLKQLLLSLFQKGPLTGNRVKCMGNKEKNAYFPVFKLNGGGHESSRPKNPARLGLITKCQIRSEWIYEIINFPKTDPNNLKDICLESFYSTHFLGHFWKIDDFINPFWLNLTFNIYLLEWLSPSGKGDWFRRIVSSINTLAWATLFGTVPVIWTNRSKEPGRTFPESALRI